MISNKTILSRFLYTVIQWFPTFCFSGTPSLILKVSEEQLPNWNCSFAGFIALLLKIYLQKMHSGLLKYSTLYPRSLIFPAADRFELMINLWPEKRGEIFLYEQSSGWTDEAWLHVTWDEVWPVKTSKLRVLMLHLHPSKFAILTGNLQYKIVEPIL